MAARAQPHHRHRIRHSLASLAIASLALIVPATAQAHSGTPVSALDYKAQVVSAGRHARGIAARVVDGDRKLELRVHGSHTVVVLGYASEPFLRFSPAGVAVNDHSPTAIAGKLALRGSIPALASQVAPSWRLVSRSSSYAWHDHRLGPIPARVYHRGDVTRWAIPLIVDGRPDAISGRLSYTPGPASWPWLALLGVTFVVAALLASQRRRLGLLKGVVVAGAATAGVAAVVLSVGVSLVPGKAASAAWESALVASSIAAAAVAAFAAARRARVAIAGFVAVLAALIGLGDVGVLVHGYVISSLPASVVRGATATAVGIGLVAAACAASLLFRGAPDPGPRERRFADAQRSMAIPRGKPRTS